MKSKGRFRFISLSTIVLLVGAIVMGISLHTMTAARAASAPTGLHIVGNKIEDGSGHVLVPRGVDRMGTEYSCLYGNTFDGPVDQTAVSAMLTWNVGIVRVPLNEDCWLGINGEPASGLNVGTYQQNIVNWVNLLNQNGIVVILDLHWNNSGSNQSTGQEQMPDLDHTPAFWTSVASRFKSNSSVIFDLYNEPHDVSWSCWKNGSSSAYGGACNTVPFAVAGMQTLVNTVRATGASNILMLGGLAWSNDLSGWLANKPSDPKNELAASTHIYNFNSCVDTSCWNSVLAPIAAQYPVIIGEIGENDCPSSSFITGLMNWADQHGIGYLAWAWATYSCPSLISNYNGTPTAYGQGYKNHLLSVGSGITGGGSGGGSFSGYYKLLSRNSGQALDVVGQSTANGAGVDQWPDSGTANQQWSIVSVGSGYYKLLSRNSGQALDVAGQSTANAALVDQWPDSGTANQQWSIVSVGGGYYKLLNRNSGQALDVAGQSTANGALVDQWPDSGTANQQWSIVQV